MGKHAAGTPKAIAKMIKAKGLGKLKWFCQLCQRQMRDENGFRNHCTSENHLRQMALFAADKHNMVDRFSETFQRDFLDLLKRRFATNRVSANQVYQEFIKDRLHQHMTSTKWLTLSEFVKHLGREGLCDVEETPRGWFIRYIPRDPDALERSRMRAKREKADADAESMNRKMIKRQMAAAQQSAATTQHTTGASPSGGTHATAPYGMARGTTAAQEGTGPIQISLGGGSAKGSRSGAGRAASSVSAATPGERGGHNVFDTIDNDAATTTPPSTRRSRWDASAEDASAHTSERGQKRPRQHTSDTASASSGMSAMAAIKAREDARRAQREAEAAAAQATAERALTRAGQRTGVWLTVGIVVKVINRKLGRGAYYKAKGEVTELTGSRSALVTLVSGDVLKLGQKQLETVIPQPGGRVMVLDGPYKGCSGVLQRLEIDAFRAHVVIEGGACDGDTAAFAYEDISKLAA